VPYAATCFDRGLEGLFQGALTGLVWGSFVALQARRKYPAPSATKQVTGMMGGYALAIGSVMGLFNGTTCASQRMRGRAQCARMWWTKGTAAAAAMPLYAPEHLVDSLVGGFVAGFVVAVPLHIDWHTATAAPSASAVSPPSLPSSSLDRRFAPLSSLVRRVRWGRCALFGVGMSAMGAALHWIAAPPPPANARTRGTGEW
jgi:hypothetical protein